MQYKVLHLTLYSFSSITASVCVYIYAHLQYYCITVYIQDKNNTN